MVIGFTKLCSRIDSEEMLAAYVLLNRCKDFYVTAFGQRYESI